MALDVNPGDTVRVTFTVTNTGSPVSGMTPDDFVNEVMFIDAAMVNSFSGFTFSGAMATGQSKNFGVNIVVPLDIVPQDYNLDLFVLDPNSVTIAEEILPAAVTVAGVYSVAITNIVITKI